MIKDEQEEDWTLIIRPKKHLLDIDLASIWRYKDLISLFVRRDFVATYKQTVLGPFWFFIQPLISTLIYTVVFGKIAKIPTDGMPPMLFYLTGIVAWNYFASCLFGTSNTFVANSGIFGKVYFPRLAVPVSVVISNLIKFGIQFGLLLGIILYFGISGVAVNIQVEAIILIPFLLLIMAVLGLGIGIILSSMTTKYRDFSNLLGFGVQLWMYATPIIYPVSYVPVNLQPFIIANPVSPIIETFKYVLLGSGTYNPLHLLYSFAMALILLFVGILMFNKVESTFMDTV